MKKGNTHTKTDPRGNTEYMRTAGLALCALLFTVSEYKIETINTADKPVPIGVKIYARVLEHSTTLEAENLFELAQPLGNWMASLGKDVWAEYDSKLNGRLSEAVLYVDNEIKKQKDAGNNN